MTRIGTALLLAGALVAGGAALAQSGLTADQAAAVKRYITAQKIAAGEEPTGFKVSIGSTVPPTVQLASFPAEVGVDRYRYAVIGRNVVLVAADSRQIFEVYGIGY
jgi:hypothetical protein